MSDLTRFRLFNQQLVEPRFTGPGALVGWLGAVQAQDYAGAKWALGLRLPGAADAAIEQAVARGDLLRTHVLRPTWHFVLPEDIRWMLRLSAPQVKAQMASVERKQGVDASMVARGMEVVGRALEGGRQRTRAELAAALAQAGLALDGWQVGQVLIHAELDGLVASGARRGKQATYALLDERSPQGKMLGREEALAELARRYFTSHGPAALKDFAWWANLNAADARLGLQLAGAALERVAMDGKETWIGAGSRPPTGAPVVAALLPNYDEYTVAYADRSAIYDGRLDLKLGSRGSLIMANTLLLDGQIVGNWRRTLRKDVVEVSLAPFEPLHPEQAGRLAAAAQRYAEFLSLTCRLIPFV